MLDIGKTKKMIDQCWTDEIVPSSVEYIKIPNKSPSFDPDWPAHGYMDEAVALFEDWAQPKLPSLPGATLEVVRLPGRTPVILIEIPGEGTSRQTAGDGGLDRGLRPLDSAPRRRQAQLPWRGR